MARIRSRTVRCGTIVPMLAICVIALFGFVALGIDLGMLMVARTQCQNAADAAALAGARVLDNRHPDGTDPDLYDNKRGVAETTAREVVQANVFLNKYFTSSRIRRVSAGLYEYDPVLKRFRTTFPTAKPNGRSWAAMEVVIDGEQPTYFGRVIGFNSMPLEVRAVAAHRPRDLAIILDMSGSMQFSSTLHWEPGTANSNDFVHGLLNPDPNVPRFGHYSRYDVYQTTNPDRNLVNASPSARPHPLMMKSNFIAGTREVFAPNNHTIETPNGPPLIRDFRFDPINVTTPSTPVNVISAVANLRNAFHRWNPPIINSGNPATYTPPTYNWSGYNPHDVSNSQGPTPAPESFALQANAAVQYAGDRHPRKGGVVLTTGQNWDVTHPQGAARNAVDLLFASGSNPTPTPRSIPATRPPIANGNTIEGGTDWTNFYDDAWERHGYDLRVDQYVNSATSTGIRLTTSTIWGNHQGYTMGPAYWGKTFFQWPPDPRFGGGNVGPPVPESVDRSIPALDTNGNWIGDWRRRFFLRGDSPDTGPPSTYRYFNPQADNNPVQSGTQSINETLLNPLPGHVLRNATSGNRPFRINYRAVLAWLKTGPQVLPSNLRAGRIVYYTSIPDHVDDFGSNQNARFWRDYIDFVLGYSANNANYDARLALAGVENIPWPEGSTITIGTTSSYDPDGIGPRPANPRPYMNYTDNPNRPRLHFWFGPMTMLAFLNTRQPVRNWLAGTVREAQGWQLKVGVQSAIEETKFNHPNDHMGMIFFAYPHYTTWRVPMGQDWPRLKASLFYPQSLLSQIVSNPTAELLPYNVGLGSRLNGNLPNANGSTDPATGLALAHNMFSYQPGVGTGRRGASKIVILETDGVPNAVQHFRFSGSGESTEYTYNESGELFTNPGDSRATSPAIAITSQMAKPVEEGGYSLPNAPVRVYPIAFGDLFSSSSDLRPKALGFLQALAHAGNTSTDPLNPLPSEQIITGPYQTRIDNIRSVFERILQNRVQVSLTLVE